MGLINNSTDPSSVLQDPGNPDRAPSTASGHRVINRGGYKARDPCGICPLPRSGFSVMSPGAPARWLESTDGLRSASKHFCALKFSALRTRLLVFGLSTPPLLDL